MSQMYIYDQSERAHTRNEAQNIYTAEATLVQTNNSFGSIYPQIVVITTIEIAPVIINSLYSNNPTIPVKNIALSTVITINCCII